MSSTTERERKLGFRIQGAKRRLQQALKPEERRAKRKWGERGHTFEDRAEEIARDPEDPRAENIRHRLEAYRAEVNRLWELVARSGLSALLERSTGLGPGEAALRIREAITSWDPDGGAALNTWLTRAVRQEAVIVKSNSGSPVSLPEGVARGRRGVKPDAVEWSDTQEGLSMTAETSLRVHTEESDEKWRHFFGYDTTTTPTKNDKD